MRCGQSFSSLPLQVVDMEKLSEYEATEVKSMAKVMTLLLAKIDQDRALWSDRDDELGVECAKVFSSSIEEAKRISEGMMRGEVGLRDGVEKTCQEFLKIRDWLVESGDDEFVELGREFSEKMGILLSIIDSL